MGKPGKENSEAEPLAARSSDQRLELFRFVRRERFDVFHIFWNPASTGTSMKGIPFVSASWYLLLLACPNPVLVASALPNLPPCEILKSEVADAQEAVRVRKHFNGLWVSPRCEIQPGPKFILRRYHFYKDMDFRIVRFYFNDPWCCSPSFSVTAVGRFEPLTRWSSSSWIVPGGIEMDYVISRIVLVPFTPETALSLASKVNETCPGFVKKPWRLRKKYMVLNLDYHTSHSPVQGFGADEIDCSRNLDLTFHELQLLRVEQRPVVPSLRHAKDEARLYSFDRHRKNHHGTENYSLELYLGADISEKGFRPTSYQSSLLTPKEPDCEICRLVERATRTSPPRLCSMLEDQQQLSLEGEWISQRCEVRPQGFFLKQHFTFQSTQKMWWAKHVYFRDQNCRKRMFTLRAQGHYFKGPLSKTVPGARDIDFRIEEATITPEDSQFVYNLNGLDKKDECSLKTKWQRNVAVNLTATSGCKALGVLVPSVELDIVKMEKHKNGETVLLYLGQASENGSRPTSFQPPLLNCRSEEPALEVDNYLRPMAQIQLPNTGLQTESHLWKLLCLSFLHFRYYVG